MPVTEDADLRKIVKKELDNRGYVVAVHTHREGDHVVGRLHVSSAETDETVGKLVGVGNVNDLRLCFGVDAEGTMRDVVYKLLGAWEGMQNLMPSFVVKTAKP